MSAQIVFNGVNINKIIEELPVEKSRTFSNEDYVGAEGSTNEYISESSRVLKFKSLCTCDEESAQGNKHRINDYQDLAKEFKNKTGVLTSPSQLNLKGNYKITGFDIVEDTGGNFTITWEFTEYIPFNVTKQTFRVWGKAQTTPSTKKKTTTTKKSGASNISSNTKYLLKTCGLMSKGSKSKKCVKVLQKFLQAGGLYKGYKVDGIYSTYTFKAVKSAQKKRGIRQTGNWDKATRAYYQKKYNYP